MWHDEPRPLSQKEKKAVLQQMIRANILSEVFHHLLSSYILPCLYVTYEVNLKA